MTKEQWNEKKQQYPYNVLDMIFGEFTQPDNEITSRWHGVKYKDREMKICLCPECTDKAIEALLPLCSIDPFEA